MGRGRLYPSLNWANLEIAQFRFPCTSGVNQTVKKTLYNGRFYKARKFFEGLRSDFLGLTPHFFQGRSCQCGRRGENEVCCLELKQIDSEGVLPFQEVWSLITYTTLHLKYPNKFLSHIWSILDCLRKFSNIR